MNGYPLRRVNQSDQVDVFGCRINGYNEYLNLTELGSTNGEESHLFFYHCNTHTDGIWVLRVAVITAFNNNEWSDFKPLYSITRFMGEVRIPYQIIDLDKINIQMNSD